MMILAPIAAVLLQAALSRSREYEADRSGAELLGTGEPLARALQKIEAYAKQVPMNIDPAHASLYIINPLTGRKMQFASLFTTHPPTEERIARLRSYSRQRVGTPLSTSSCSAPATRFPTATARARPRSCAPGGKTLLVRCRSRRRHAARGRRHACRVMLDAVLLTHLHSDHICDLNDVVTTHWVMSLEPKTLRDLRAAAHAARSSTAMLAMLRPDVEYRLAHHDDLTWEPAARSRRGRRPASSSRRTACASSRPPTDHRPVEPTVGYRVEHDGEAVVIAGDTVPCAGLDELCAAAPTSTCRPCSATTSCAWCRCSGSATRSTTTRPSCRPRRPRRAAACGTLVLTHQIPTPAPGAADEWIAIAREHFAGEIVFGEDLTTVTL